MLMRDGQFFYPLEEVEAWEANLPTASQLSRYKEGAIVLVPPPPADFTLSLRNLSATLPGFFTRGIKQVLASAPFAQEVEKIERPYALRKITLARSMSKGMSAQQALIAEGEALPTALEVAWAMACYYFVRDRHLFEHTYVRSGTGVGKDRILIGMTSNKGCTVKRNVGDDACQKDLGITSVWRL